MLYLSVSESKSLKMKTTIHTAYEGQEYQKCEFCGKSFSQAKHLRRHIHTVHEGHRDYECEECEKVFTELRTFERHLHTVHDGYKDHKCEFCGKSFSKAGDLKSTFTQFMKVAKITNVNLVVNHFHKHQI